MSEMRRRVHWLTGWQWRRMEGCRHDQPLPSTYTVILPPQGGVPPCLRKARGLGGWVESPSFFYSFRRCGPAGGRGREAPVGGGRAGGRGRQAPVGGA